VLQACSIARKAGFAISPELLALERECLGHVQAQAGRRRGRRKTTVRDLKRLAQVLWRAEKEADQVEHSRRFLRDLNRLRRQGVMRSGRPYGTLSSKDILEFEEAAYRIVTAGKHRRYRRGTLQTDRLGKIAAQMFPDLTAAAFRKTLQTFRRKGLSF
jgi:hypothetical protein